MKKKVVIVGSSGNFGNFIFRNIKKNYKVLGIDRKKNHNNFKCDDLSDSTMNLETFGSIKQKFTVTKKVNGVIQIHTLAFRSFKEIIYG